MMSIKTPRFSKLKSSKFLSFIRVKAALHFVEMVKAKVCLDPVTGPIFWSKAFYSCEKYLLYQLHDSLFSISNGFHETAVLVLRYSPF